MRALIAAANVGRLQRGEVPYAWKAFKLVIDKKIVQAI